MRASNRKCFWAALLLCVSIAGVYAADSLPSSEDVDALGARAARCDEKWESEGAKLWLIFEYNEELLDPNEKSRLLSLVKETSEGLGEVTAAQARLKKQIEDYEGDDWEARYGATGLWERLESQFYNVMLRKLSVDMRLAELSEQKEAMLRSVLKEIDAAIESYDTLAARMIRVKVLGRLVEFDEDASREAIKTADRIADDAQATEGVKIEMEVLKARLTGTNGRLGELAEQISAEEADNIELVMGAVSAAREAQDDKTLNMLLQKFSDVREFLGGYVLAYVERCVKEGREAEILPAEAEVAALAAALHFEEPTDAVKYLAGRKDFQSAGVLFEGGLAWIKSNRAKAVELMVKSSRVLKESGDEPWGSERTASLAASVAYQGWRVNEVGAREAIAAFDNYMRLAQGTGSNYMRRWYSEILQFGAEDVNDMELYGEWEYRARLVREASSERELREIIEEGRKLGYGEVRGDAAAAYCGLLLESYDAGAAEKVLKVCSENEDVTTAGTKAYKAKALARLGRVDEAVGCMADVNDFKYAPQAVEVLDKVAEGVEELMERGDWAKLAADCNSIAEFCGKFIVDESRPAVVAEMILVCGPNEKRGLARAEKLLAETPSPETIDYIRCHARVLAAEGKYIEAAGLWAQIGNALKADESPDAKRPWQWWRAKYYELECLTKTEAGDKAAIAHSIEVLENSFDDIPALWARKLTGLKNQCMES